MTKEQMRLAGLACLILAATLVWVPVTPGPFNTMLNVNTERYRWFWDLGENTDVDQRRWVIQIVLGQLAVALSYFIRKSAGAK